MSTQKKSKMVRRINKAAVFFGRLAALKKHMNEEMEGRYSPSLIALAAAAISALLMALMLFCPNYLGVGDDGSFKQVMGAVGISYLSGTEKNSNEFFNRVYLRMAPEDYHEEKELSGSQIFLVKAAVWLDDLITGDMFFDIRILALLYGILYVPAVYLLIRQACMRVNRFSEGIVIGIVGVVIFADAAYLTYFNSLYPEALWYISLLYCLGAAISFQESRKPLKDIGALMVMAAAGGVLMTSRSQCAFLGMIIALYSLKLLFAGKDFRWSIVCVLTGMALSILSVGSMAGLKPDFDETDKFHAMTRGVLFGADYPAKALKEFGIESSYELLADVSAYDYLPAVRADEDVIKEEFLNKYTAADVGKYYLRHPGKFVGMVDIAIKSCFGIRRDFCGNYERSVGLPGGAKSIFWSAWSTFKNRSAPKTIGCLAVLMGASCLLFGKGYSLRPEEDRRSTVLLDSMAVLLLICFYQAGVTIVNSGDAEMAQHCFLIGCSMDIMTYFVFAQLAHKINIF